jgi:hypothetical protein
VPRGDAQAVQLDDVRLGQGEQMGGEPDPGTAGAALRDGVHRGEPIAEERQVVGDRSGPVGERRRLVARRGEREHPRQVLLPRRQRVEPRAVDVHAGQEAPADAALDVSAQRTQLAAAQHGLHHDDQLDVPRVHG